MNDVFLDSLHFEFVRLQDESGSSTSVRIVAICYHDRRIIVDAYQS